ncbi:MAG: hypothetical protein U5M51_14975 [Emticicia sp.]|nr:hypothetical protein [Emticicia sp.]
MGAYGEIKKILGIAEGLLWVIASGNETTKRTPSVVGVSPQSSSVEQYFDNRLRLFDIHGVQFSEKKKSLVCFNPYFGVATYLFELNLPDLTVKREVRLHELEKIDTQIRHFTLQDGLVYFTARKGNILVPTRLGVLDFATLELLRHENIIENSHSFKEAPQVANDKLYALDTGGTLRVFERKGGLMSRYPPAVSFQVEAILARSTNNYKRDFILLHQVKNMSERTRCAKDISFVRANCGL